MVKIPITSEHLVPDITFLIGKKILFRYGWESWSYNDHKMDIKEYIATLGKNKEFSFKLISSEGHEYWSEDLANYADCPPCAESSDWYIQNYDEIIDQCDYEVCYIDRTMNNIEYSSFLTPPLNDWLWEKLSAEDDENERLHNYILDKLCKELQNYIKRK